MLEQIDVEAAAVPPLKPAETYTSCSLHQPVQIRAGDKNLAELNVQTIPKFFRDCCQRYKDLPALRYETPQTDSVKSKWSTVTYAEYEQNVEQTALLLLHLGVQPHTSVAILAFNCPEWFYVELAALRIGAVAVGIYSTSSSEAVHHVLETSQAAVCFVDDVEQMSKVRSVESRLNQLRSIVQLNGPFGEFVGNEPGYYGWKDLYEMKFSSTLREELLVRERDVAANECALLIYTSGTVGMPKAAMISHDNVVFGSQVIEKLLMSLNGARGITVSYLPLNHIAAQLFDMFMIIRAGGIVYFADRNALKGSLIKTCAQSGTNVLFGVPRVYEKWQEAYEKILSNSSALTRLVMNKARSVMENYHIHKIGKQSASCFKYWMVAPIINRIKVAMGLDRLKICVAGGAPVTEELKKFFLGLDMPIIDVYGMTESSGCISLNFDNPNLKTVGKAIEGIEIKIDHLKGNKEGEILVRGRCNFMGYLKDEEKTLETFTKDGYIRTGDVGYLDEQENLYISGRIKELIITAGGENIPPAHIEALIKKELPCVSNAMVVGDHRKYLTVLLTLKTDIDPNTGYPLDTLRPDTIQWLHALGAEYNRLSDLLHITLPADLRNFDPNTVDINCDDKVSKALQKGIKRSNLHAISSAQKVQYFTVLPHDFSVPTNELGPTLKIKRNVVLKKYSKIIEKMYVK